MLLTASRGMFRLVTLPAEPAARDVHGTTGVRVDRPVVETPRGLDPVTLVHSNSGADFAGDSVAPSVVAVAEAPARDVYAGRRVRIDSAVVEASRRRHGVRVVGVVAHHALHRGDVAEGSANLPGHLVFAHAVDPEALGGRRGEGGTAAVSAEADAGDAAVGVDALAPPGLRRVVPVAVGLRRISRMRFVVVPPLVPTVIGMVGLTAVVMVPRIAVAVVLPRTERVTAAARLRAVRAHHTCRRITAAARPGSARPCQLYVSNG